MRIALVKTLVELADMDPRILLLTGDLGYQFLEPFSQKFPDRFFNVGVAEQNMVGIATGLAEAGYIPFVYSIAPFAALRPYEFIRNGPIEHQLPVRIIGMGGGVDYSTNGLSHYGIDDLGVMRVQPGITILAPADSDQARSAILSTWDQPGPIYLSLGKDDNTRIPGLDGRFHLGEVETLGEGKDVLIFSIGSITMEVLRARDSLLQDEIHGTVAVVSCLNPVSTNHMVDLLTQFKAAYTVEAHYINGGLGSLIAEIIAENGLGCKLTRMGFKRMPDGRTGSRDYLFQKNGISASSIYSLIKTMIIPLENGRS